MNSLAEAIKLLNFDPFGSLRSLAAPQDPVEGLGQYYKSVMMKKCRPQRALALIL